MTEFAHLWLFFVILLGVVMLPGLDMAYVLGSSLTGGRAQGMTAVAGMVTGGVVHVTVGALGLAALLAYMPGAFNVILVAGALYIAWIGFSLLQSSAAFGSGEPAAVRPQGATFRQAMLTNLLNPKAYLFMLAIFPQFMRPEYGTLWIQAVVLGTIIAFTQAGVYGMVAYVAGGLREWMRANPQFGRRLNRTVGLLLVVAAIATGFDGWQGLHPQTSAAADASPVRFAITDVTVIDGDGSRAARPQTVFVDDGRIRSVTTDTGNLPDGTVKIDGSGRYLMPGLIDLHAHSFADDRYFQLLLRFGVTTIRDMGCSPACTRKLAARRARGNAGDRDGPRVFFTGPNLDGPSPFDYDGHINIPRTSVADALARLQSLGVDAVKVRDWLTVDQYDDVLAAARNAGLPVVGHVALAVPMLHAVNAGQRSIEHSGSVLGGFALATSSQESALREEIKSHMDEGLATHSAMAAFMPMYQADLQQRLVSTHDDGKTRRLAEAMRRQGTVLVPTMIVLDPALMSADAVLDGRRLAAEPANRYVPGEIVAAWADDEQDAMFGAADRQASAALFVLQQDMLRVFHEAGVQILVGTDAAFTEETRWVVPGLAVHQELLELVNVGMTPAEAIAAATGKSAEFLGLRDVGHIAAGQVADLILLDEDPLANIRNTRTIVAVVSQGVYRVQDDR